jgi:ribosomal protein S14
MRSVICSDTIKRKVIQKKQINRKLLRLLGYLDSFVYVSVRVFNYRCYWVLSGYSCSVKVRKRCFFSGRRRGVRVFGLSRHDLRGMMKNGFVNGLFRATW